ncbi:MAG: DNA-processing protein DprA [Clostridia bacterium]
MVKAYFHGLNVILKYNAKTINSLLEYFDGAENCWQANNNDLKASGYLRSDVLERFIHERADWKLEEEFARLAKENINFVTIGEKNYPSQLLSIADCPPMLYYLGDLNILNDEALKIAVVGSRKNTDYGSAMTERLASGLAEAGVTIISGLASGIDSIAHKAAIKLEKKTIAVLGCGVDVIYPLENKKLRDAIVNTGCIISEFPPETPPLSFHFPRRNRIISGLAQGVLVVEASINSGSLITAEYALEQGKDVFAVPGPVLNKQSVGCNKLIKQGAMLVETHQDILEEYQIFVATKIKLATSLTPEERAVIFALENGALGLEELLTTTGLTIEALLALLTMLELQGLIKKLAGSKYVSLQNI